MEHTVDAFIAIMGEEHDKIVQLYFELANDAYQIHIDMLSLRNLIDSGK